MGGGIMGHRQQMTPKQRLEWDTRNYKLRLEAKRGHNHSYMTDELYSQLENKGYKVWKFEIQYPTESQVNEKRDEFRKKGYYARIICSATRLRIRQYELYYKGRVIIDPDGDGKQWLYCGMRISEQIHPKLLPYACYDCDRNEFLIGVTTSKKLAIKLIDKYISEGKNAIGYQIYHG